MRMWLNNQIACKKQKKLIVNNVDIKNIWNNFIKDYKKYLLSHEELWIIKLNKLKNFIDLNKRRPSRINKTEKQSIIALYQSEPNKVFNLFQKKIKNPKIMLFLSDKLNKPRNISDSTRISEN